AERDMARLAGMHVVFCCNVLPYFADEVKDRVIALLGGCLVPGGYLVVGQAELFGREPAGLLPIPVPGAVVYKKT
ncbi:MAG: CheR family methyltransferase, partial [bacterium]